MNAGLLIIDAAPRRYRLGAEELLELGNSRPGFIRNGQRPYLAGRTPVAAENGPYLGDILATLGNVAGFIVDGLAFALNTLGDLVDLPLNILAQGVDVVFNGLAGILQEVPVLGDLLAQILVMGGSLIKFGLSVPGLLLHGLGNILGGVAKALKSTGTEGENEKKVDGAKKDIIDKAPDHLKDSVQQILSASGVSGSNLTPSVSPTGQPLPATTPGAMETPAGAGDGDLGTVLAVGASAVGVLALISALA